MSIMYKIQDPTDPSSDGVYVQQYFSGIDGAIFHPPGEAKLYTVLRPEVLHSPSGAIYNIMRYLQYSGVGDISTYVSGYRCSPSLKEGIYSPALKYNLSLTQQLARIV